MLKRENRLRDKPVIRALFSKGEKYFSPCFLCKFFKKEEGGSRFSIVVSKKISKKAVIRNRIKRRLAEAIRLNIADCPPVDAVIFGSEKVLEVYFVDLEKEILKMFKKFT